MMSTRLPHPMTLVACISPVHWLNRSCINTLSRLPSGQIGPRGIPSVPGLALAAICSDVGQPSPRHGPICNAVYVCTRPAQAGEGAAARAVLRRMRN